MKHEDIQFNTRRQMAMNKTEQDNGKISKEPDKINPKDLPEYIQLFIHLFNKKKIQETTGKTRMGPRDKPHG